MSGSSSSSMRSRASSLPRARCRATYFSPPPARALACSASSSASFPSMASRWARVLGRRGVQRGRQDASQAVPPGMSTCRERSHSPSALACGSKRACAATPSPSRPSTTKLRARRFGRTCRTTVKSAVSGSSSRNRATVSAWASQRQAVVAAHPDADVGVAALVAAAGSGDEAEGGAAGRAGVAGGRAGAASAALRVRGCRGGGDTGIRRAVGQDGHVVHGVLAGRTRPRRPRRARPSRAAPVTWKPG